MSKPDNVYVGVALDRPNEKVIMATFVEDDEAKARRQAEERCPGMPVFVFRLFDTPAKIKKSLDCFLIEWNVPPEQHNEVFGCIVQGLKRDVKRG